MNNVVGPALTAATGAIAMDITWAYLPLPLQVKTGPMKHIAKAAGALGVFGFLAPMVVKKSTADAMAIGALSVVAHQAAREMIAQFAPQIRMDGIGYYSPALPVGGYNGDMGLYVPGSGGGAIPTPAMGMYNEYDEMGVYVG